MSTDMFVLGTCALLGAFIAGWLALDALSWAPPRIARWLRFVRWMFKRRPR